MSGYKIATSVSLICYTVSMFPLMEPLEGQLVKEEGGEETRLIGILYLRLGRASPKTGQYLSYQI